MYIQYRYMILPDPLDFQWDKGNTEKNLVKHGVSSGEVEEAFFDENRVTFTDVLHSDDEERFRLVGKTFGGRLLFIVFTIRNQILRVISARDINRKEEYLYYEKTA